MESRGARIAKSMQIVGSLALGAIVVLGLLASSLLKDRARRNLAFSGVLVAKEQVFGSRRSSGQFELVFETDDGETIAVRVATTEEGYFYIGDYVIKFAGEERYAVFRKGRQVKAAGLFLDRPIDLDGHRRKNAVAQPPPETPLLEATPAPVPMERIDALVAEASALWRSGDGSQALARAKEALALCEGHLGAEHDKTLQVRRMVDAAAKVVAPK